MCDFVAISESVVEFDKFDENDQGSDSFEVSVLVSVSSVSVSTSNGQSHV